MNPLRALAALTLLAPAGAAALDATHQVVIQNGGYNPPVLQVAPGDTVVWTHRDGFPHTVTAFDGSFASPTLSNGQTFSATFPAQGIVPYHCLIHPRMVGLIVVL